jgi:hypothetical protein
MIGAGNFDRLGGGADVRFHGFTSLFQGFGPHSLPRPAPAIDQDHFVGGPPSPANCDGVSTPCRYAKKGEIDGKLGSVIATEFGDTTPFAIHFDTAPTFYIKGNPWQTDPATRNLEREAAAALGFDPVAGPNGGINHPTAALADQAEQKLLHMVTADPNRTPNFIMFGNPDYFFLTSGKTTPPRCQPANNAKSCFSEDSRFAWNHGDFQNEITNTWLGIVGPGMLALGTFGDVFSDETHPADDPGAGRAQGRLRARRARAVRGTVAERPCRFR